MHGTEPQIAQRRIDKRLVGGAVRVSPLKSIPAILREHGCDPEIVFSQAGFDPAQFEDPDNEIPFVAGSRLLERCVTVTGCQHFGLLMGQRANASSLGIAGFMLRFAPDVRTALGDLERNLDLHDTGGVPGLDTRGDVTLLGYAVHQSGAAAVDQIHDMSTAVACNIMRELCGADWNPTRVLLSRRAPNDPAPYERFFRATVRFDSERNAVVFPTRLLDQPLTSADPLLYRYFIEQANELRAHRSEDIVERLRRLLRKSLADRKFMTHYIASQLCMHERTLHRRLQEAGTTYRHELEDIRYAMARQMLADSAVPQSRIAVALGYASATAFGRAFKRWSGVTPSEWRARHGHP
ncbi:MAG: AraC family transcriptional regulator [Pseudomonadota bacterium]|nr:AraC family transcriptional regulator [Pseudomonadota bacterium]